jgi:hypothetical protein
MAFELPPQERLELARQLVESVITPHSLDAAVSHGIQRIEEVLTDKTKGLNESEFRGLSKVPEGRSKITRRFNAE